MKTVLCHGGGFLAFLWSKNGAVVKGFGNRREVKVETAGSKITGAGNKIKRVREIK